MTKRTKKPVAMSKEQALKKLDRIRKRIGLPSIFKPVDRGGEDPPSSAESEWVPLAAPHELVLMRVRFGARFIHVHYFGDGVFALRAAGCLPDELLHRLAAVTRETRTETPNGTVVAYGFEVCSREFEEAQRFLPGDWVTKPKPLPQATRATNVIQVDFGRLTARKSTPQSRLMKELLQAFGSLDQERREQLVRFAKFNLALCGEAAPLA